MEELIQYLGEIKIARQEDKIYKDECVYSFDTPVILLFINKIN